MKRQTQAQRTDGLRKAGREVAKINNDVLAAADNAREIVEIPEGLDTGYTLRRKRGARTDDDVIEEALELHGQGLTMKSAVKFVGLPWATWHKWNKENHCDVQKRYEFAHYCHMEAMADKSLQVIEGLINERKAAKKRLQEKSAIWHEAHRKFDKELEEWNASDSAARGRRPVYEGPIEPKYDGPEDWELAAAREQLRTWQLHMAAGIDRFKKRDTVDRNVSINQSLTLQSIDVSKIEPGKALETYHKLLELKGIK